MKVIVKDCLIIFRRPDEWSHVSARLVEEYGPSIMISWKLKRELGFTIRRHKGLVKWSDDPDYADIEKWLSPELQNKYHYEEQIHLDFFNKAAQTWFQLKYL